MQRKSSIQVTIVATNNQLFPKELVKRKLTSREKLVRTFKRDTTPLRFMSTIYASLNAQKIGPLRTLLVDNGIPSHAVADISFVGKELLCVTTDNQYVDDLRMVMTDLEAQVLPESVSLLCEEATQLIGNDHLRKIQRALIHRHKRAHECKDGPKKFALLTVIDEDIDVCLQTGECSLLQAYVDKMTDKLVHVVDRMKLFPHRNNDIILHNNNETQK